MIWEYLDQVYHHLGVVLYFILMEIYLVFSEELP